jgi:thymidine kinase
MSITLILGPMYSEKTSELFSKMRRAKHAKQRVKVYKYVRDVRSSVGSTVGLACTHDGVTMEAEPIESFEGVGVPNVDVIGIDEGQFLNGIADFAQKCAWAGIHVYIAALNGDYLMKPWENIQSLIPISENIIKHFAVCSFCGQDAAFTKKIDGREGSDREDIGGTEKYAAACRECMLSSSDED